ARAGFGRARAVAVLLGVGRALQLPRQRPDLSGVRGDRGRPARPPGRGPLPGRIPGAGRSGGAAARRDRVRLGDDGRELVHRERAELHGQGDRRRGGGGGGPLLWLYCILLGGSDSLVCLLVLLLLSFDAPALG